MAAYVIPSYDEAGFAQRLIANTPQQWSSDAAKAQGGVLYALMAAVGASLSYLQSGMQYGQDSIYIQSAVGAALDLVSQDYFGSSLPRYPGETDASFRARIQATLFQPAATTAAVSGAITRLVGVAPRIMFPWSPASTGVWDGCYWDVDTAQTPFRWADYLPYQGFIISQFPGSTVLNGNAMPALDDGIFWDSPGQFLGELSYGGGQQSLDQTINTVKPEGTVAWVQIATAASQGIFAPLSGTANVAAGTISVTVPITFGGYYVVGAQASWLTDVWPVAQNNNGFTLEFSTAAPAGSGGTVDWWVGQAGALYLNQTVPVGDTSVTLPAVAGHVPYVTPNWNTTAYGATGSVQFNTPAPGGALAETIYYASNMSVSVPSGSSSITVTIPTGAGFKLRVQPNWNTMVAVTKSGSDATLTFSVASPINAEVVISYG